MFDTSYSGSQTIIRDYKYWLCEKSALSTVGEFTLSAVNSFAYYREGDRIAFENFQRLSQFEMSRNGKPSLETVDDLGQGFVIFKSDFYFNDCKFPPLEEEIYIPINFQRRGKVQVGWIKVIFENEHNRINILETAISTC